LDKNVKKYLFLLVILVFLTNISALGDEMTPLPKQIRAIYGMNLDIEPFTGLTPELAVEKLQAMGANVIFGGYENKALTDDCHRVGIPVYAEVSLFIGDKYWKEYPDSRPVNSDGKAISKQEWYAGVDPSHPEVRRLCLEKIRKLCADNDIDGVWLDFIRWPCHWEAADPLREETSFHYLTVKRFAEDTNTGLPFEVKPQSAENPSCSREAIAYILDNLSNEWYQWRADQIISFTREARSLIKSIKPNCLVGMFTLPWRESDHDNAMYKIVGQDLAGLAPYVDIFSPMTYHIMLEEKPGWVAEIAGYVKEITGKPVVPIIQACSVPTELTDVDFAAVIKASLAEPSDGTIVFTLKHMANEKNIGIMEKIFKKYLGE
jgi:Putative glycosyl hydrolase domain